MLESFGVTTKVFADDTKIYQAFRSGDKSNLQIAFDKMRKWSIGWQLPLSAEKTRILHLGGIVNPCYSYYADNVKLDVVTDYIRDLGFIITPSLSFEKHCKLLYQRANHKTYNIFKALDTKRSDILLRAYKTYVRPLVEYGTTVYSPNTKRDSNLVERIQNNFTRKVLIRKGGYTYCKIPGHDLRNRKLNLDTLCYRRKVSDQLMMHKILVGNVMCKEDFFKFSASRTRGMTNKISFNKPCSLLRKASFVPRAGSVFLDVTKSVATIGSIKQFRTFLKQNLKAS